MLKYKLIATFLFVVTLVSCGCGPTENEKLASREQMLKAQQISINSIEIEMTRIREGNGVDMSKWSPDTVKCYQMWQDAIIQRYVERERLIDSLSKDIKIDDASQPQK